MNIYSISSTQGKPLLVFFHFIPKSYHERLRYLTHERAIVSDPSHSRRAYASCISSTFASTQKKKKECFALNEHIDRHAFAEDKDRIITESPCVREGQQSFKLDLPKGMLNVKPPKVEVSEVQTFCSAARAMQPRTMT